MSADWKRLTREAKLKVVGDGIHVSCGRDRFHTVNVDASDPSAIRIWSKVVTRGQAPLDAALSSWKMNRYRELVGFKLAEHGRVIGEAWIPTTSLSMAEWSTYVHTLARACDRLEYLWTGRDAE